MYMSIYVKIYAFMYIYIYIYTYIYMNIYIYIGAKNVLVTLGEKGSLLLTESGDILRYLLSVVF
jgi:hypothetical protein